LGGEDEPDLVEVRRGEEIEVKSALLEGVGGVWVEVKERSGGGKLLGR
jgi:hypothetical protein